MPKINNQVLRNTITAQQLKIDQLSVELRQANDEAIHLCMAIYNQHYKQGSPNFELCDSTAGIISQIDNMVAGLSASAEKAEAQNKALLKALEELDAFCETGYSAGKVLVSYCSDPVMDKVLSALKETAMKPIEQTNDQTDKGEV